MHEFGTWRFKVLLALVTVDYEDACVRVVRLHIPEHVSLPTHERPRRVVELKQAVDPGKPLTHRVRNDGKAEYHTVLVQVLN